MIIHRVMARCLKEWRLWGLAKRGRDISVFGPCTLLCREKISMGNRISIAGYLHVWGHGGVEIGDDVLIASHVAISSVSHGPRQSLFKDQNIFAPVKIGNNVWIGSHAFIDAGVCVGEGSVIAAGSVVLKDVPMKAMVAGVPAEIKKKLPSL